MGDPTRGCSPQQHRPQNHKCTQIPPPCYSGDFADRIDKQLISCVTFIIWFGFIKCKSFLFDETNTNDHKGKQESCLCVLVSEMLYLNLYWSAPSSLLQIALSIFSWNHCIVCGLRKSVDKSNCYKMFCWIVYAKIWYD